MAYVASLERVLLFGGGISPFIARRDTFTWDGEVWARLPRLPSPSRRWASMAFDAARGEVVLFGGAGLGRVFGETWTWDGSTWTLAHPRNSPPARSGAGMAYDQSRAEVVLFGGFDQGNTYFQDTWVWDGTNWERKDTPVSPPRREFMGIAYDAARGEVVVFGGHVNRGGGYNRALADTWTWDGVIWTERTP